MELCDAKFHFSGGFPALYLIDYLTFALTNWKQRSKILRIHWRLSMILKGSNRSVLSNIFGMQKYLHSESSFNTLYIEIKHARLKNALFFLSRAPIHHSFTFNLRFLTNWSTRFISKFRLVFIKGTLMQIWKSPDTFAFI